MPALLAAPVIVYMIGIYAAALGFLVTFSFFRFRSEGRLLTHEFSLENYMRLLDPLYAADIGRTMAVSGVSAALSVLLSYPLALWIIRSNSRWRVWCLAAVILSMFVVSVVRVFSWTLVLGREGFINRVLLWTGLLDAPLPLLYNVVSVTIVEAHYLLPFTALTLIAGLQRIDSSVDLAAKNLGGDPYQVFWSVTLPLSRPALMGAFTLSFALTLSSFATPLIIGGGSVDLVANVTYELMLNAYNLPFASAMAIVALVMSIASLWIMNRTMVGHAKF